MAASSTEFQNVVENLRRGFKSGKTRNVAFREELLQSIKRMYDENEALFLGALKEDLRKPRQESIVTEIQYLRTDIDDTLKDIRKWTEPEYVQKNLLTLLDTPVIHKEPYGVVLVLGAWNYPLQLTMLPVHGAIAAGNCVLLKPSEVAPAMATLLKKLLPRYINSDYLDVVCGGVPETTALLENRFDYIFYTGNPIVGKIIGAAAMKYLTPVTLELGGKSPCYLDDTVNFDYAVRRIMWGKCLNVGQTCIAPDYLLCNKDVEAKFIEKARQVLLEWYGDYPKHSPDLTRIINDRHFVRLEKLLDSGKTAIGAYKDRENLYISPTILVDVKENDPVMQEEIFGPILPIYTVNSPEEAIEFINTKEKPLTMYVFSESRKVKESMVSQVSAGSVCFNDTIVHIAVRELPFGGVGNSGMGCYHGKFSFDTFSHRKSCLIRNYNTFIEKLGSFRYPPYTDLKTRRVRLLLSATPTISFRFLGYLFAFGLGIGSVFAGRFLAKKWGYEDILE